MNKGSIAQLGTPSDLYEFPASRFVADFIGSVNMFEGKLIDDKPDEATVACPELDPIPSRFPMVSRQGDILRLGGDPPGENEPAQGCRRAASGARMSASPQRRQG